MIFSVLPSKSPATSSSSALNTAAESVSGPFVYNIVLDAGSTGSRIHIYKFKQQGKQLQLISDGFHQLKPGLSAFPDNPEQAAQSLKPLMAEAIKEVPTAQQVHGAWGRAAIVWVWVAAIVWVWVWSFRRHQACRIVQHHQTCTIRLWACTVQHKACNLRLCAFRAQHEARIVPPPTAFSR